MGGGVVMGSVSVLLVLCDNIFYGHGLPELLVEAMKRRTGATVFGYAVTSPEQYGVVELSGDGRALSIEERQIKPKSTLAVTGLIFYDKMLVRSPWPIKPPHRGGSKTTVVNRAKLAPGALKVRMRA